MVDNVLQVVGVVRARVTVFAKPTVQFGKDGGLKTCGAFAFLEFVDKAMVGNAVILAGKNVAFHGRNGAHGIDGKVRDQRNYQGNYGNNQRNDADREIRKRTDIGKQLVLH